MATVPLYQTQVQPAALRPPYQQVDPPRGSFGGVAAAAQQDFGDQLGRMAQLGEHIDLQYRAQRVLSALSTASTGLESTLAGFATDQDFQTQEARFGQSVEAIQSKARQDLGSDYDAFAREFDPLVTKRGFDVQKGVLEKRQGWARASLDETGRNWVNLAAGAGSDKDAQYFLTQGALQIDTQLAHGLITPEDAVKRRQAMQSGVLELRARKDMLAAPSAFLDKILTESAYYEKLDAPARQRLIEQAQRQVEMDVRRADHADTLADKERDKTGKAIEKLLWQQADSGQLTRSQIDAATSYLEPAAVRALLHHLHEVPPTEDNPLVVSDLETRLDHESIERDAALAVENGDIKPDTFRSIVERNRSALADTQPAPAYKRYRGYIAGALDPGALSGFAQTAYRQAQANALMEFDRWRVANPSASEADYDKQAQTLIRAFQLVATDQMSIATGLPAAYQGTRKDLSPESLDKAEADTLAKLDLDLAALQAQPLQQNETQDVRAGSIAALKQKANDEIEKIEAWRQILATRADTGVKP